MSLLPEGEYDAVVYEAREKTSQAGNPMVELMLTVYGPEGATVTIFDNLVSTPRALWKLRHFMESAGLDFSRGELLPDDVKDKNVRIHTQIEKQTGFQDKNKVVDYLPRDKKAALPDDDLPF